MLQTQVLGQYKWHCHNPPQGCEEVLWVEQKVDIHVDAVAAYSLIPTSTVRRKSLASGLIGSGYK